MAEFLEFIGVVLRRMIRLIGVLALLALSASAAAWTVLLMRDTSIESSVGLFRMSLVLAEISIVLVLVWAGARIGWWLFPRFLGWLFRPVEPGEAR